MNKVEEIAAKCGLSYTVCYALLNSGWTYVEEVDQPGKWVSPVAQMKKISTEPTMEDVASPEFQAVWQAIKKWDISRGEEPLEDRLYANATGTDVMTILNALRPFMMSKLDRRIPVVIGSPPTIIGWLMIGDSDISDETIANCGVSWALYSTNKQLYEMRLVPRLRVMIENDTDEAMPTDSKWLG